LPATTIVVLFTTFATYHWLGFLAGDAVADDAKWTSVFSANIHFGLQGTSYLASEVPPSPLQHMWSLGVEEQFYLAWPTVFFLLALVGKKASARMRLGAVLVVIVISSLSWSIIETAKDPTWAYFSPATRAWELALGGLVAVAAPLIARVPSTLANLLGGVGLGGVILGGLILTNHTPYPGSAVVLPVVSSAVVIAAGCVVTEGIAEQVLSIGPCQWLGKRSFSFYLWHWPILIIALEYAGHQLTAWQNTEWLLVALAATVLTYHLIENPIRFASFLTKRTWLTLTMGAFLIGLLLGVSQLMINGHKGL
jgi:peptidoglycan/LPS O-acetylase OafA/YrhL